MINIIYGKISQESSFISVITQDNNLVMFSTLFDTSLGFGFLMEKLNSIYIIKRTNSRLLQNKLRRLSP